MPTPRQRFWLMKSEPEAFSIDDLKRNKEEFWDGVRNYQARNFMRDMCVGDLVLFYHSNTTVIGCVGVARVVEAAHPDQSQFDPTSQYYDPKATKDNPRWDGVRVQFVEKFKDPVTLDAIKRDAQLQGMVVAKRGSRLSVTPVTSAEFKRVCKLAAQ